MALLLDIDGVLVRDKLLLAHVKSNCVDYVRAKLPECKNPTDTNNALYLAHGHTARGLKKVFGVDTRDFNKKVYDKRLMDHLSEVIYGTEFQLEAKDVHDLSQSGWNVTLFTNSPPEWAMRVAQAIGHDIKVKCPVNDYKPSPSVYLDFPNDRVNVFVDDSLKNIGTARWLDKWLPVHFNEGERDPRLWCPTVGSIWELSLLCNSIRDQSAA